MTNRLTQDALENMFSIMRQKNGYNRNPTARMFRCCFDHICSYNIMKCSTSCNNCEPDDDEYMAVDVLKDVIVDITEPINIESCTQNQTLLHNFSEDSDSISSLENNYYPVNPSLEACSNVYFSGYLANKCFEKFKCGICESNLRTQ